MLSNFLFASWLTIRSAHAADPCLESEQTSEQALPDPFCIFETEGGRTIDAHSTTATEAYPVAALIGSILDYALLLAGGLAIIALIYSGIMYLTAYGDEKRAGLAKRNATWAVIGIIVIVLSYTLVHFIS